MSLNNNACRVERLSVQMTMVLVRLCCSAVVTSFIAETSAWKTELKSDSLKDDKFIMMCGELFTVVKKSAPTPLLVREPLG